MTKQCAVLNVASEILILDVVHSVSIPPIHAVEDYDSNSHTEALGEC